MYWPDEYFPPKKKIILLSSHSVIFLNWSKILNEECWHNKCYQSILKFSFNQIFPYPAKGNYQMAHFLRLQCPHRHLFHFLTPQQLSKVVPLDTKVRKRKRKRKKSHQKFYDAKLREHFHVISWRPWPATTITRKCLFHLIMSRIYVKLEVILTSSTVSGNVTRLEEN